MPCGGKSHTPPPPPPTPPNRGAMKGLLQLLADGHQMRDKSGCLPDLLKTAASALPERCGRLSEKRGVFYDESKPLAAKLTVQASQRQAPGSTMPSLGSDSAARRRGAGGSNSSAPEHHTDSCGDTKIGERLRPEAPGPCKQDIAQR